MYRKISSFIFFCFLSYPLSAGLSDTFPTLRQDTHSLTASEINAIELFLVGAPEKTAQLLSEQLYQSVLGFSSYDAKYPYQYDYDTKCFIADKLDQIHTLTLKRLSLSGFGLQVVPEKLFNIKGLYEVHLDKNQLTSLPLNIAEARDLEVLLLYDNYLTVIPEEMKQLTKLKFLNVAKNAIQHFPNFLLEHNLPTSRMLILTENDCDTYNAPYLRAIARTFIWRNINNPAIPPKPKTRQKLSQYFKNKNFSQADIKKNKFTKNLIQQSDSKNIIKLEKGMYFKETTYKKIRTSVKKPRTCVYIN